MVYSFPEVKFDKSRHASFVTNFSKHLCKILIYFVLKAWRTYYQRRFGLKFGVEWNLEHDKNPALWFAKIGLKESEEVQACLEK